MGLKPIIRKVDRSGQMSIFAGNRFYCYNGDGSAATQAALFQPTSVVADAMGNVYFDNMVRTPQGLNLGVRVRRVASNGTINTVAGSGEVGFAGGGGPALQASFGTEISLGLDATRDLLIADMHNHRVRRVDSRGVITTIAGNGSGETSGDGRAATAAGVPSPTGVTSDATGNIYISSAGSTIRRVATDGIISTYAGGQNGFAGDGGPASAGSLAFPRGLATDSAGNLYIADQNNGRIRKVSPKSSAR